MINPSALKGIFEVFGKSQLRYFDNWIQPIFKSKNLASVYCAETFIYKIIYYGGTYGVLEQLEGFHGAINPILIGASFVPGPVGMVACFIDGLLYALTGDFMSAGVAFLGMIPGIKQLGLFSKFIKAFQKCPVVSKIFSSWNSVTKFFDKIAKNMEKIKITPDDVTKVCGNLVEKHSPQIINKGKMLGKKLVTYTPISEFEAQKEILSYAGKGVYSGAKLLQLTIKSRLII